MSMEPVTNQPAGMPEGPAPAVEAFTTAVHAARVRGQRACATALGDWSAETERYIDGLSRDTATLVEQVQACRTPADLLAAEGGWIAVRSIACLEVGARLLAVGLRAADLASPPPGRPH